MYLIFSGESFPSAFCKIPISSLASGDTDVVVKWKDEEDKYVVAIIDGKSKSGGRVSHSDISETS